MSEDPKRLVDGADSPELQAMLSSAQDDGLADDAVLRVRAALVLGGPLAAGAGAGVGAKAALPTSKVLVWVVGAITAATFAGVVWSTVVGSAQTAAPDIVPGAIESGHASSSATTTAPPSDTPSAAATAAPEPGSSASGSGATTTMPIASGARVDVVNPTPTAMTSAAASASAPSPREGLLLLQARQKLATDPQGALDLVRRHELDFPKSQLAPERAKLAADARAQGAK